MATVTSQDSTQESTAATGGTWVFDFAAVSILLALAYGLPSYVEAIYGREHLQFALLIPVGVVFLWMLRQDDAAARPVATGPIHGASAGTVLLFALAALLCLDSLLGNSAVSWALALLTTAMAFIHFWGGWTLFRQVFPLWLFGCLMIPPPFGLDQRLITDLQLWVSKLASYTLDSIHVAHVLEGNVIRIEGKDLFVAEACSGINSLFATIVVLIFSMLVLKRGWLHVVLLFALGFCCVLAVNVIRVSSLTAMYYYNPKLGAFFDQGAPHFAFGMLCFALLILLVFSMDSLLWLIGNFFVSVLPARWGRNFSSQRSNSSRPAEPAPERSWLDLVKEGRQRMRTSVPRGASLALGVGVLFALLAGIQYSSKAWQVAHRQAPRTNDPADDPLPALLGDLSQAMPANWDGWQRVGEKSEHLNFTNAMFSTSWTYRKGSEEMIVFLHRRYFDFHGMDVCYAGNGWQIKNLAGENLAEAGADSADPAMQLISFDMDKEGEGSFVVAYVNFDYRNRRWVEVPPIYRGLTLAGRIELALRTRRDALANLFARDEQSTEIAIILVQRRTTRGAEEGDRRETLDRAISASNLAFAPLLPKTSGEPRQTSQNNSPQNNSPSAVGRAP